MGRAPCCEKVGLKKGRWTSEEDGILIDYIQAHGEGSWRSLPQNAGLLRCGKSCRLRWLNYLRADVKRGNISSQEEDIIISLHASLGNRWSLIAGHLPGRTDNEIKNYWNSRLSRKIQNFNSPRNNAMPNAFVNLSKFITGTCRRRRGRTGAKDITPPSSSIQHVESSNYKNGFDEMLGQLEEQSVVSWPSEESTNAIKVCSSYQGSFESEFMSLDDILGSGVSRHKEEIDNVDQGNVSSHETERDVTNMHGSSGGLLSAANSWAVSEEWADWTWDCNFQDQRMLDEEEMLSWLRDGSNA